MADGELVVCGRLKDVIILGGRNVFPEDIERAVAEVDGVRAGNVIAFGVAGRKGREGVVVVAEVKFKVEPDAFEAMRATIAHTVRAAVGFSPEDIALVGPETLPKTSFGKLQRSLCRSQYLETALSML